MQPRRALIIGNITDNRSQVSDVFIYDPRWNSEPARWIMDNARKDKFYFDNEKDVKEFQEKVTEFARNLYQEYLADKETLHRDG